MTTPLCIFLNGNIFPHKLPPTTGTLPEFELNQRMLFFRVRVPLQKKTPYINKNESVDANWQ